jgi:glycine hydroxymethyltransferase
MGPDEMKKLAEFMDRVVRAPDDEALLGKIASEVKELCASFPPPGIAVN